MNRWYAKVNVCSLSSNKGMMFFQAKLASSDLQTLHIAQTQKGGTSCFRLIKKLCMLMDAILHQQMSLGLM